MSVSSVPVTTMWEPVTSKLPTFGGSVSELVLVYLCYPGEDDDDDDDNDEYVLTIGNYGLRNGDPCWHVLLDWFVDKECPKNYFSPWYFGPPKFCDVLYWATLPGILPGTLTLSPDVRPSEPKPELKLEPVPEPGHDPVPELEPESEPVPYRPALELMSDGRLGAIGTIVSAAVFACVADIAGFADIASTASAACVAGIACFALLSAIDALMSRTAKQDPLFNLVEKVIRSGR